MVEVGTAQIGEKEINKDYPIEDGLTAGTTKTHDREWQLQPTGIGNIKTSVPLKDRQGLE